MTHRDRPCGPSDRREAAGDAVAPSPRWRQGLPTPSDGPQGRPERRLAPILWTGVFGQRPVRLAMPRIAAPRAPCRKPLAKKLGEAVSMGQY